MSEIKVGDIVEITGTQHYDLYSTWANLHDLKRWGPRRDAPVGSKATVVAVAPHSAFNNAVLAGIELESGVQTIFHVASLRVVEPTKPKLKLPLSVKVGATNNFVLVRGDGDHVTLIDPSNGQTLKNYITSLSALGYLECGHWTVVGSATDKSKLEEAVEDAKADVVAAERALSLAKSSLAKEEAELANYKPNYLE